MVRRNSAALVRGLLLPQQATMARIAGMQLLDLTLATPEENVALDEALLEEADVAEHVSETLRIWESPSLAVVIGRSSRTELEVDLAYCAARNIPVLRRCSGGAAVVLGPGCLMYSVVLSYTLRPELHMIDQAHRLVLGRIAESLQSLTLNVRHLGISDLALDNQKVSGNSLRCKRHAILYHGTLLYDFALDQLAACLRTPPRQPEYRAGRNHRQFVTNLPVSRNDLRNGLLNAWPVQGRLADWPRALTEKLVAERYSKAEWNLRF
jgi:lipoate-protein ligase A